jgi:hypothetical protein
MSKFSCRGSLLGLLFTTISVSGFYSGNILVLRVTTRTVLSDSSTAVFVDEIALNGSLAQMPVAIPTGGASACTLSGNDKTEGQLSMSPNGANVALACYMTPEGTPAVVTTAVQRAVVVLNANGSLNSPQGMGLAYTDPARHVHSAVM